MNYVKINAWVSRLQHIRNEKNSHKRMQMRDYLAELSEEVCNGSLVY